MDFFYKEKKCPHAFHSPGRLKRVKTTDLIAIVPNALWEAQRFVKRFCFKGNLPFDLGRASSSHVVRR